MNYKYHPKTPVELRNILEKEIFEVQGSYDEPNWEANLNCIDVSSITNFNYMFNSLPFKGNVSDWIMDNAETLESMFESSDFRGDLSGWKLKKAKNVSWMFRNSNFNGDAGDWPNKEELFLENISISPKFSKLPDYITTLETILNIIERIKTHNDISIEEVKSKIKNVGLLNFFNRKTEELIQAK